MHFYAFSILLTSLQLVRAYPQTPENQQNECSLTWQPRDHDRPPLYGVEQKMIGLCQPLSVSCSKGLTLPVPQTECPNEYGLRVPCCFLNVKCGVGLRGRCMNISKPCHDGAYFLDKRCPEGEISCCEPNYTDETIDEDGKGGKPITAPGSSLTAEESGEAVAADRSDRVFASPESNSAASLSGSLPAAPNSYDLGQGTNWLALGGEWDYPGGMFQSSDF